MKWQDLTQEARDNFMEWAKEEYVEPTYSKQEIEDIMQDIPKNLYYVEDGLTFQF